MVEPKAEDIEELKRLPPKERLRKLKELEEKRKKEIEEAEKLIRESVEEIKVREKKEEEELTTAVARRIERPEEETLEETVGRELPAERAEEERARVYETRLPQGFYQENPRIGEIANREAYGAATDLRDKVRAGQELTEEELQSFYTMREQINHFSPADKYIREHDPGAYLQREKKVLEEIAKYRTR